MIRFLVLLLGLIGVAQGATSYPNPLASGTPTIGSSLLFSGTQYVSLGQPAALTSVLLPTHEFTILLRRCRALPASTGVDIALASSTATTFSIATLGGSSETGNIGGTSFNTGAGSIGYATWNSLALVCHNVSGTFMGSIVLDGGARSTEVAVGAQSAAGRDIMVGARRNSTNTDAASFFSGNIGAIAIWNYALTDNQIHSAMGLLCPNEVLYTTFQTTNFGTGLIAYYPCSEGSGTTVNDCVAGNNGTATTNVFTSTAFPHYPAQCWGDSLTNGSGSETNTAFGNQTKAGGSGLRNMRSIMVNGYSGQPCSYIATQQALAINSAFGTWTQVYYVGIHDLASPSTVTTFLTTSIAAQPHNRWIEIGVTPEGVGVAGVGNPNTAGPQDWGVTGSTGRPPIDTMNNVLGAYCGARFINEQARCVALATLPTEANDVFQFRMPCHCVSSIPHPLDVVYIDLSIGCDQLLTSLNPMW